SLPHQPGSSRAPHRQHTAPGPVTTVAAGPRTPSVTSPDPGDFLRFVTTEAAGCPTFKLIMQAEVEDLIVENDQVRGVRYRNSGTNARYGKRSAVAQRRSRTALRWADACSACSLWYAAAP